MQIRQLLLSVIAGGVLVASILDFAIDGAPAKHADSGFLYFENPRSLAALYELADTVALVQVEGPIATRAIAGSTKIPGAIFTDSSAVVLQMFKGRPADRIIILQNGGSYGNYTEYNADDPVFQPNTRSLLFLRDISGDAVQAPGAVKYREVSPAGRFDDVNGRVGIHYLEVAETAALRATSFATLLTRVQRLQR